MVILAILEPFLTSEVAAIFEHIPGLRVEGPKRAFSRFIRRPGNFDKTVVETQRMPNGILPALLILTVEWEQIHYKLIKYTYSFPVRKHTGCFLI